MMGENIGSFFIIMHIGAIFSFLVFLAFIFSIIYVAKFVKRKVLLKWITWLLAVGIVGGVITMIVCFSSFSKFEGEFGKGYFKNNEGRMNVDFEDVNGTDEVLNMLDAQKDIMLDEQL